MQVFDAAEPSTGCVVGRIAAKGLVDELQDRSYLVVDGIDGRAQYVALAPGTDLSSYPRGGVVEVSGAAREPRPADRAIAAQVEPDRLYRPNRHLADARRYARPDDDPDGFIAAHVRRLEELRRAGIVERRNDGVAQTERSEISLRN